MPELLLIFLPFPFLSIFLLEFNINSKIKNIFTTISLICIMIFLMLGYSIYFRNVEFLIQYISFLWLIGMYLKALPSANKILFGVFCLIYYPLIFLHIIFSSINDFYSQGDPLYENEDYFITIENRAHMLDNDMYLILNKKLYGIYFYKKLGEQLFNPSSMNNFTIENLPNAHLVKVTVDGQIVEFEI